MVRVSVPTQGGLWETPPDADDGQMHARYVPVTQDEIDAVVTAACRVDAGPVREALEAIVRSYEASSVSCIHAAVFRTGSGGRCADCGSWV
jgi:hypothetical protein